jgi:transcriptional regulator with XRE-family HTH domain
VLSLETRPVHGHPPARYQHVADMLRDLRKRADVTQEDLARRLSMTLSGYRPYEQGRRNLKIEQIPLFASALGVPISTITSMLWPEEPRLVETRYSHDWDELQAQTEHLPPEIREQVLRSFRESIAMLNQASALARRN